MNLVWVEQSQVGRRDQDLWVNWDPQPPLLTQPSASGLTSLSLHTCKCSKSEFTVLFWSKILHKAAECWPAAHHPVGMAFSFTTLWQTPDVFLWPANISQKQSESPSSTSSRTTVPSLSSWTTKSRVPGVLVLEATIFLRNCKI